VWFGGGGGGGGANNDVTLAEYLLYESWLAISVSGLPKGETDACDAYCRWW